MDTANSIEMIRLHMFISHIPRFPAAENRGIVETPAVLYQYRPILTRAFPTFKAPESGFILIHCRSPPALRSDATAQRGNRQSCSLFASGIRRHPSGKETPRRRKKSLRKSKPRTAGPTPDSLRKAMPAGGSAVTPAPELGSPSQWRPPRSRPPCCPPWCRPAQ